MGCCHSCVLKFFCIKVEDEGPVEEIEMKHANFTETVKSPVYRYDVPYAEIQSTDF